MWILGVVLAVLPRTCVTPRLCASLRMAEDGYEAKNPLISLLGKFLPQKPGSGAAESSPPADPLDSINWDAPKQRGLGLEAMAERLDAGLREREWFVTGRALPELFSERYAFSDPDVSLSGIQQYCRQVRAGPRLAPASDAIAMID